MAHIVPYRLQDEEAGVDDDEHASSFDKTTCFRALLIRNLTVMEEDEDMR